MLQSLTRHLDQALTIDDVLGIPVEVYTLPLVYLNTSKSDGEGQSGDPTKRRKHVQGGDPPNNCQEVNISS